MALIVIFSCLLFFPFVLSFRSSINTYVTNSRLLFFLSFFCIYFGAQEISYFVLPCLSISFFAFLLLLSPASSATASASTRNILSSSYSTFFIFITLLLLFTRTSFFVFILHFFITPTLLIIYLSFMVILPISACMSMPFVS
ncbi:hypothetical protein BJ165DRAFT_288813 [Panaeolus papilionaceus]|nr:hypothetical protein BJ165DRAFT_288813 [Panaeolus papilionaceus]